MGQIIAAAAVSVHAASLAEAERQQALGSDPRVSAFVSASAGSGKTKLLTDRLLRLMLEGTPPERILCLTFTKAAAAEMALRLQQRLGGWASASDAALDKDLRALGFTPTEELRRAARALFAHVLDLPGGMRIETIHAFCESLLRRFPLEAQVSPHFQILEETDARPALRRAYEEALAKDATTPENAAALFELAALVHAEKFGDLVQMLYEARGQIEGFLSWPDHARVQAVCAAAGAPSPDDTAVLQDLVQVPDEEALRRALERIAAEGAREAAARAQRMLAWLEQDAARRLGDAEAWLSLFFRKDGGPVAAKTLVNKALSDREPDLLLPLLAEQQRLLGLADARRAAGCARATLALIRLAAPALQRFQRHKAEAQVLDFDDLIERSKRLLADPGAGWVLYKLDGGLDHLLIDEAQDTAPVQWEIAGALTEEFFAGEGAREVRRTVFAVGDHKQSIFSFQGADPDAFERWRGRLRQRVRAAGEIWRDVPVDVSFRSTAPVLALVDAVFVPGSEAAQGVLTEDRPLQHRAVRVGQAGSVELWPLAPHQQPPERAPWEPPRVEAAVPSALQRLAEALAEWIDQQLAAKPIVPSRNRPLVPGDVLVLVRRRNAFATALVRALKARGVPVAGLDRMVLTEQPAVADLLALCDTLLLPEDDLALACVLTSPLGGLSDAALMDLALGRKGFLWDALRSRAHERADWRAAWQFLSALFARVDYVSPHALLVEALGPLGGRARLLARFGAEAAEPIDELLHAALSYGRHHAPSLQGFVQWLRASGAEVKRQAENASHAVRLMTVHGAKGLQAPIVILPDTTGMPPVENTLAWKEDAERGAHVPLWAPRKELRSHAVQEAFEIPERKQREEHNRLLYVALTRAEDRLIVCGWEPGKAMDDACWYRSVARGFERLSGCASEPAALPWEGSVLRFSTTQPAKPSGPRSEGEEPALAPLPRWMGGPPTWAPEPLPGEPKVPTPLAPSRPENAAFGPVPAAASPLLRGGGTLSAQQRGTLLHALLQHLPDLPETRREQTARTFLSRPGLGLQEEDVAALVREIMAVLRHPELAPLFGPASRAEVPITGVVGGHVIGGIVDRLAVAQTQVLLADYKTGLPPPEGPERTPVLYLRQMAAYRAVLAQIFPAKAIRCALIWTQNAKVSFLPDALLQLHAPDAMQMRA
jgi:ATP-dependent helicase/nuclease subunit A